ncbi:MAG: hypothetical protein ACTSPW_13145 [Promethearchaeota archaeon]
MFKPLKKDYLEKFDALKLEQGKRWERISIFDTKGILKLILNGVNALILSSCIRKLKTEEIIQDLIWKIDVLYKKDLIQKLKNTKREDFIQLKEKNKKNITLERFL